MDIGIDFQERLPNVLRETLNHSQERPDPIARAKTLPDQRSHFPRLSCGPFRQRPSHRQFLFVRKQPGRCGENFAHKDGNPQRIAGFHQIFQEPPIVQLGQAPVVVLRTIDGFRSRILSRCGRRCRCAGFFLHGPFCGNCRARHRRRSERPKPKRCRSECSPSLVATPRSSGRRAPNRSPGHQRSQGLRTIFTSCEASLPVASLATTSMALVPTAKAT